jgi:hypothetical protein
MQIFEFEIEILQLLISEGEFFVRLPAWPKI